MLGFAKIYFLFRFKKYRQSLILLIALKFRFAFRLLKYQKCFLSEKKLKNRNFLNKIQ